MTAEPKPLAVGDRVRLVHDAPGYSLGAGSVGIVRDVDEWTARVEFTRPRSVLLRLAEVERMDPAPPADDAGLDTVSASPSWGELLDQVRILTAERGAALAELNRERRKRIDTLADVANVAAERDTALARAARAEALLATLEDRR